MAYENGRKAPRRGRRLTEEEKAKVRELHADGMGRNKIAKATGIPPASVSEFCEDEGLKFSTKPYLKKGRMEYQASLREMREQVARKNVEQALKLHARIEGDTYKHYVRNRNDELVLVELPEAPVSEMATIMNTIGRAMDTHVALLDSLGDKTAEEEKSMLDGLLDAFKGQVAEWDGTEADNGEPE
ncbi:hypothetical protein K8O93_01115 [Gordonia bronchialis]|uniref:hypothetical protein n=1 Tax=Gordonia bronchialis TaxID=2054 RepID=UPI001CBD0523|nr:hypothetical protein [Gordonia bronchialis]UAK38434.1 hypothetical protein K8O93_01115 [Gordonia bronchialis]